MKIEIVEKTSEHEVPELLIYAVHIHVVVDNEEARADWHRLYDDEQNIHQRGVVGQDMWFWREEEPAIDVEGFEVTVKAYNPLTEGADRHDLIPFVQSIYQNHFDKTTEIPYCDSHLQSWVETKIRAYLESN